VAAVLFPLAAELFATYVGRLRDEPAGPLRLLRGSIQEVLLLRRPGDVGGLGEAYDEYAKTTDRLVPHVW
jgi:hypothetical protein